MPDGRKERNLQYLYYFNRLELSLINKHMSVFVFLQLGNTSRSAIKENLDKQVSVL